MKNSNQKVMQTYGKFFNRPKMEKRIVDKWGKDVGDKKLFDHIHQHIFNTRPFFCYGPVHGCIFTGMYKGHVSGMFFSLFDFHCVK
jgi:hypothetical protein